LKAYELTDNCPLDTHEEVRGRLISNYLRHNFVDLNTSNNKKLFSKSTGVNNRRATDAESPFNDNEDQRLDMKYIQNLINMNKLSVQEVNEKILMINDTSKKFIADILEQTIFNIIGECINGESDLTVKTAIYFKK
jgi:hypothetical protein